MELRGRRAKKPQSGFFSRHYDSLSGKASQGSFGYNLSVYFRGRGSFPPFPFRKQSKSPADGRALCVLL